MKKLIQIITITFSVLCMVGTPIAVHAQDDPVIEVGDPATLPSTGATPATPDTGIEPANNKVLQNAAVFTGGGMLGVGIGLAIIRFRKKQQN